MRANTNGITIERLFSSLPPERGTEDARSVPSSAAISPGARFSPSSKSSRPRATNRRNLSSALFSPNWLASVPLSSTESQPVSFQVPLAYAGSAKENRPLVARRVAPETIARLRAAKITTRRGDSRGKRRRATLPVDTRDWARVADLACIRGRTDSPRRQGGRRGLTGSLARRRGRNGPSDAHIAPTYPIFGRVLPRGLRVLRQPTAPGASRHHRGPAGSRLMTYRAPTVQRRAL